MKLLRLKMNDNEKIEFDPERWGLPINFVESLGKDLYDIWERFRDCFSTLTNNKGENALTYLQGILLMEKGRNYVNISRKVESPDSDGQNLQNFMSDSPWKGNAVFDQIQHEVKEDMRLQGGILTLDESGERRYGDKSAGMGRQYLGVIGKVDMGQVGVYLGYYAADVWTMVDGELFFPEKWFDENHKQNFKSLHIPEDLKFRTKPKIGLELLDKAIANKLPFQCLTCDDLYGRGHNFRKEVDERNITYVADVPWDLTAYIEKPETGIPERKGGKGRKPTRWKVLNDAKRTNPRQIAQTLNLTPVEVRDCERGKLIYECGMARVWTITSTGKIRQETLFVRREANGKMTYSLSNAPKETSIEILAQWRSGRYFAERIFQDSKSELGMDEFEAQKYRAWIHHTALDALALWFIAQTKLNWKEKHPRDPKLNEQLGIQKLPDLSAANVRLLLQTVMPLEKLSLEQAINLVVKHLVNRSKVKKSKSKSTKKRKKAPD